MLKRFHFSARHAIPTLTAIGGIGMLLYGVAVARPLWLDEQMILLNVRDRSFGGLAGGLWLDQSAPTGWLVLQKAMLLVFGSGERAVRLLTALFGSGTLLTALWIGRQWMTPVGATAIVALCAFGEWLVFFTLELKHYSSDALCALLLPALAAWAVDAGDRPDALRRRVTVWWLVAAAGQWFANGAIFVAPATAVVLVAVCWRRLGLRGLPSVAIGLAVWLISFGFNFVVTLRPALENAYLKNYWAFAFPPVSKGVMPTLAWLLAQLEPMAVKPAGTRLWHSFWIAWTIGIASAITRRQALGWTYAAVPFSAVVLALARVVPPFERLGIWFVPSLYVGVALCADAAVRLAQRQRSMRTLLLGAVPAALIASAVVADVAYRGARAWAQRPRSNYGLDDRSSVRLLSATHRPGDPILTTHYGTAAIWWYAGVNIAGPSGGSHLPDGSPLFEVKHATGSECAMWNEELSRILAGHTRADVYLGFRLNVEPPDFGQLVLTELSKRGRLTAYKEYAEESRVATFDLTQPTAHIGAGPSGCMSIKPAARW